MAITAKYSNVLVLANGDSFVGPAKIKSAMFVAGSGASTATLTSSAGSVKILDCGSQAAGAILHLTDLCIRIIGGHTITAAVTGTGALLYLYLE